MAAMLYQTDSRTREMRPANGVFWTYDEKKEIVGGHPAVVYTIDGDFMVINDMGKLMNLDLNIPATRIYQHGRRDVIRGDALVIESREELEGKEIPVV